MKVDELLVTEDPDYGDPWTLAELVWEMNLHLARVADALERANARAEAEG